MRNQPARHRLWRDRRGGVALMFGVLALPMMMMIGVAIDVGFTVMAKAKMDLAADAAALSAATTAAQNYQNNVALAQCLSIGQATGITTFNGQASTTTGLTMGTPTITVTEPSGGVFTATLTYSGSMATNIAQFFGQPQFAVQGTSTATITVGGYADIHVLMDVSSSMGIAATQAAINTFGPLALQSDSGHAQGQNCAFGCHWSATNNDFYGLAIKNNIPLRISTLISAVQSVVSQLISLNTNSAYRIALYSFNSTFSTIYAITNNLAGASNAAAGITVPLCCGGNDNEAIEPDTNWPAALTSLTSVVGTSGTGANSSTPKKFAFIITDGVSDYLTNVSSGNRVLTAMSSSNCAALKTNGVTVLVLYTQYTPLPTNSFYVSNVAPFAGSIPTNLQACASSPQLYFYATDPTSIQSAMQQMLQYVTASAARFTK